MPTTSWISQHRPALPRPTPEGSLLGMQDDWEATYPDATPVHVRTLFLRGSECRFHCTMCDLWQHTYSGVTPPGDIPEQIRQGLSDLSAAQLPPTWLKLYNASSFFDPKNIPIEDLPTIAALVATMQCVIVENHPRLLPSDRLGDFVDQLQPAQLEVAMGLETVHEEVLHRLNKQMTVPDYQQAVVKCHQQGVSVRAFILLGTPWLDNSSAMIWCQATIDTARDMGVRHISVIPVRGGNGALEQLMQSGQFTPPTAHMLEQILIENLSHTDCLVTVDLWDWDKLRGTCSECSFNRRLRLAEMNLYRKIVPPIGCEKCDVG